ncbi:MAG: molybdopterin-synthase adenylyltransferase MoeB [Acidobacteriota bacterium]
MQTLTDATSDLTTEELQRYGRHLILPEVGLDGQRRLKAARVLLIGLGGLGSPAALYLAAAGIGTLGLVEFDVVERSNLQRQLLYGDDDVGRSKLDAACTRLRAVNPHLAIERHDGRLEAANAQACIAAYDVVVDGSDNAATRYLVNDACARAGVPNVWGAVARFEGQVSVFDARRGPCYRSLFPTPPPAGLVPSCAEGGVLGVLPGMVGAMQANEVIKLVLGVGEPLIGRLLILDALGARTREVQLPKTPCADVDCPCRGPLKPIADPGCSADSTPIHAADRANDPGRIMNDFSADVPLEISIQQLQALRRDGVDHALVDVRETAEHDICRIDGATLIPLRTLPEAVDQLDREALTVVHCHHGGRSAQAVAWLRQNGFARATNLVGGIDAWSLTVDPAVPRY